MVQPRFVRVNDLDIAVRSYNASSPDAIILIHFNSGSSAGWQQQISSPLLNNYHLITIDLPGHGDSSKSTAPETDYTLAAIADAIAKVISSLKLKSFIMAGISLGTNIIGESVPYLSGCKGYLLAAPSIIGANMGPGDILKPYPYGDVLFSANPPADRLEQYLKGLTYNYNEQRLHYLKEQFRKTDPLFRVNMGKAISEGRWADEIGNLKASGKPVAVIFGQDEQLCYTDYLDNAGLELWGNKVWVIPHAGHLVNFDEPEVFNELLAGFAADVFK